MEASNLLEQVVDRALESDDSVLVKARWLNAQAAMLIDRAKAVVDAERDRLAEHGIE